MILARYGMLCRDRAIGHKLTARLLGSAAITAGSLIAPAARSRLSDTQEQLLVAFSNVGDQLRMMNVLSRCNGKGPALTVVTNDAASPVFALYRDAPSVTAFALHGAESLKGSLQHLVSRKCRYRRAFVPFPYVTQPIAIAYATTHAQEVIAIEPQPGTDYLGPVKRVHRVALEATTWRQCFERFFMGCFPGTTLEERPCLRDEFQHRGKENQTVLMHTLSASQNRSLPFRIVQRAIAHVRHRGLDVVLLGSASQAAYLHSYSPDSGVKVRCGAPLAEVATLMAQSRMFVGIDSSMMNLADAVGLPSVIIYGPTDPSIAGPFYTKSVPVLAKRKGFTIDVATRINDPDDNSIGSVDVIDVLGAVDSLLLGASYGP